MYTGKIERVLFLGIDSVLIAGVFNIDECNAVERDQEADFLRAQHENGETCTIALLQAFCPRHMGSLDLPSADSFDCILLVSE